MINTKGFTLMELIVSLGILSLLLIVIVPMLTMSIIGANNGTHKGYITAIEKSGIIFKTYSIYIKTDLSSSQEDKYCLENKDFIAEIEDAISKKEAVLIKYENGNFVSLKTCSYGDQSIVREIQ